MSEVGAATHVNDTAGNLQAVKAYQMFVNALPAYPLSFSPASGATLLNRPKTIAAMLADAGTQVDTASVTLKLNGQAMVVTATKTAGKTKVVHNVVGDLLPSTDYTAQLAFTAPVNRAPPLGNSAPASCLPLCS